MKLAKGILVLFSLASSVAYADFTITNADFTITNHTEHYGSAFIEFSPCSSSQGDAGILKPHGSLTIPATILTLLCPTQDCQVHTFMTKNCSGKEVATIHINPNKGVLKVQIHDKRFVFTSTKYTIDVTSS